MVLEHRPEHESQWAAIMSIAAKIGCTAETLRRWVRQKERDSGVHERLSTAEAGHIKALEREVRERRQVNEILRKASAYFGQADFGRPFKRRSRSSTITAPSMGSSRSASGADYPIDLPRP